MKDLLQKEGVSQTHSHWKTVTQKTTHNQRQLASLNKDWSKQNVQSPDEGHDQGLFRNIFGKVRTYPIVPEGNWVEPTTVCEAKQTDNWVRLYGAIRDKVKALQDNKTWNLVRRNIDWDLIQGTWFWDPILKSKIGSQRSSRNTQSMLRGSVFVSCVPGAATGVNKTMIRWKEFSMSTKKVNLWFERGC